MFAVTEDANGANLPSQCGPWTPFKILDLNRGEESTPGLNTRECLDDIQKYGLHVTDSHIRITERVV